MLVTH